VAATGGNAATSPSTADPARSVAAGADRDRHDLARPTGDDAGVVRSAASDDENRKQQSDPTRGEPLARRPNEPHETALHHLAAVNIMVLQAGIVTVWFRSERAVRAIVERLRGLRFDSEISQVFTESSQLCHEPVIPVIYKAALQCWEAR
jgi:hypothetical protein